MTAELAAQVIEESDAVKALEQDAPVAAVTAWRAATASYKNARAACDAAKRKTDAAYARWQLFNAESGDDSDATASDDRPSVDVGLWSAYRQAQRAETLAHADAYDAGELLEKAFQRLKKNPDANDKDECCDGCSCL